MDLSSRHIGDVELIKITICLVVGPSIDPDDVLGSSLKVESGVRVGGSCTTPRANSIVIDYFKFAIPILIGIYLKKDIDQAYIYVDRRSPKSSQKTFKSQFDVGFKLRGKPY